MLNLSTASSNDPRRKAVWGPKVTLGALAIALALPFTAAAAPGAKPPHRTAAPKAKPGKPNSHVKNYVLDDEVTKRSHSQDPKETTDILLTLKPGQTLPPQYKKYVKAKLGIIGGYSLNKVPVKLLSKLGSEPSTNHVHFNRPGMKQDVLSLTSVQADVLAQQYGYTGAGVTVAVVDSGFSSYPQPDLTDGRVIKFVDFVNPSNTVQSDLNGHGTHVAGIIGGTGALNAKYAGVAPGANIVSLRVLDENGQGSVGDIIAALDWVSQNYIQYNIRVVSMSVGAGAYESYWTDPLTLAAKDLVDKGIVVVAAAGNRGQNALGQLQWGGITSPGIAPWVLTACAFSTMGTFDTSDDVVADFSSSGPTAVDFGAKPDLCAAGVGIVSLAAPESQKYADAALAVPTYLVDPGNHPSYPYEPYLSLSGTSQATPLIAGTVALMLQANPTLTPNLIKAMLEFTATPKPNVSRLRQGAGFMNALGAVELAKFYGAKTSGSKLPTDPSWNKAVTWGSHVITGGVLDPKANAWTPGVEWGWAKTLDDDGDNIVWGTACAGDCHNIVWSTSDDGDNIVWGTSDDGDNIVWGTDDDGDNIVWGTSDDGDNIVWGTSDDGDNIVWGTDCGGDDCDNIVWGTSDADNIVWGTADDGDNIVWGTSDDGDNIVWGTDDDGDNIVWGTSAADNVVWPVLATGGK